MILDIHCNKATGAHILSILLGVIVFITVPPKKNTTRNHIATLENLNIPGKAKPDLDKIIMAKNANINAFNTAINLIFNGYLPGNLPPIDAAPQGSPQARHN